MSQKISITYFGFDGTGSTVKEAKQVAGRKIEALHEGYWTPWLREWMGHVVVIYRNLRGYDYAFIKHPDSNHHFGGSCSGWENSKEAIAAAERHLVGLGWKVGDPMDLFPEWFTDAAQKRDIQSERRWQTRMRELMDAGHSDTVARQIIDGLRAA